MKIALAQQNYHIGNFAENARKIIEGINWAKSQGADLVVFPSSVSAGYPPRDFLSSMIYILFPATDLDLIREQADSVACWWAARPGNPQKAGKTCSTPPSCFTKKVVAEMHKTFAQLRCV